MNTKYLTCKYLRKPTEVEEPPPGSGEELPNEHYDGEGGEDHGQDHERLHRLQPICDIKDLRQRTVRKIIICFRFYPFREHERMYRFQMQRCTSWCLSCCHRCSCARDLLGLRYPTSTRTAI